MDELVLKFNTDDKSPGPSRQLSRASAYSNQEFNNLPVAPVYGAQADAPFQNDLDPNGNMEDSGCSVSYRFDEKEALAISPHLPEKTPKGTHLSLNSDTLSLSVSSSRASIPNTERDDAVVAGASRQSAGSLRVIPPGSSRRVIHANGSSNSGASGFGSLMSLPPPAGYAKASES